MLAPVGAGGGAGTSGLWVPRQLLLGLNFLEERLGWALRLLLEE